MLTEPFWLAVFAAASLTQLLAYGSIFDPWKDQLRLHVETLHAMTLPFAGTRRSRRHARLVIAASALVTCRYCLSIWVTVPIVFAYAPTLSLAVTWYLPIVVFANMVLSGYRRLGRT